MGAPLSKGHESAHRPLSDINVTPMVDVMLVLLIIFMVTAPMMVTGVDLELPESSAGALEKKEDTPLTVSVTKDGAVYFMDEPISVDEIYAKATAIKKSKKDIDAVIRGDKNVDYGVMMQVIAEINRAGFSDISLLSDDKASR
ncbi:MAG: ExbD/TolR family protein [Rickettsiales bacterium]